MCRMPRRRRGKHLRVNKRLLQGYPESPSSMSEPHVECRVLDVQGRLEKALVTLSSMRIKALFAGQGWPEARCGMVGEPLEELGPIGKRAILQELGGLEGDSGGSSG